VVPSIAEHPLPRLRAAGIRCTINTDDPAMFGTDLGHEYEVAETLGVSAADAYTAGIAGALCDEAAKGQLRAGFEARRRASEASADNAASANYTAPCRYGDGAPKTSSPGKTSTRLHSERSSATRYPADAGQATAYSHMPIASPT
jgi:hypothetical protein